MSPAARPVLAALLALLGATTVAAAGETEAQTRIETKAPEEEDLLRPSPFGSAEEAIRDLRRRNLRSAEEASPEPGLKKVESARPREDPGPKDVTVTGAVTVLEGERLGFMPVLLHHMAVEHWFLTGLDAGKLKAALAGGERCYVKLKGRCELKGVWSPGGGGGLDWYGNGLSHGPKWGWADPRGGGGGVNGYHERVYELAVKEMVWARSPADYARLCEDFGAACGEVYRLFDAGEHARALETLERCSPTAGDVGIWHWDSAEMRELILDLLAAAKPPERWEGGDVERLAGALVRAASSGWPWNREKVGRARLDAAMERWPKAARERVAAEGVRRWRALEYRHQKEALLGLLEKLGGPEFERLRNEVASAKERLKALSAAMDECAGRHDYEGLLRAMDEAAPHQAIVLDYEMERRLNSSRRRHAEECRDFARQWRDEPKRLAAAREALGRLLAPSRTGRGDDGALIRPRLSAELSAHFLPQLPEEQRVELSGLAAELSGKLVLDNPRGWEKSQVLGELLAGLGTAEARAQLAALIERRLKAKAPKWEIARLRGFSGAPAAK